MTNTDRAAEIIERATRGAHTTDGHPMKMSDHTTPNHRRIASR